MNESKKLTDTQYLNSEFLQGANAGQLVGKFDDVAATLGHSKLMQISSDGLSMNLKVSKIIVDQQEEWNHLPLIDIETCGLHTVKRSIQSGVVSFGWKIEYIFRWTCNLLKNSSARGEVYENVTKVNVCELPYCKVTSCENELIAEQAAEIWPHFHKFVDHLMSLP